MNIILFIISVTNSSVNFSLLSNILLFDLDSFESFDISFDVLLSLSLLSLIILIKGIFIFLFSDLINFSFSLFLFSSFISFLSLLSSIIL